ncbi:M48 family metallopeptidase [Streptomyces sp. NPDC051784]|uniref:M48 family metallopeptidase n=1 Tax=Streptomyces sp. NPDC051784 TaxID=3155805 RepID=UPI0034340E89
MSAVVTDVSRPCPRCGATLWSDPRFTSWCGECDWNVDPQASEGASGRTAGHALTAGARRGDDGSPGPRHDQGSAHALSPLSLTTAYAVAMAVHGVTVVLAVSAVWCVVRGWGGLGAPLGVVLMFLAWTVRPRLGRPPRDGQVIVRDEAPALYGLVDEVAEVAGTRGVDVIVVDTDFNAGVQTCGVRGRRVLALGLPLWEVLGPQERIALLGHELGHYGNGDTRRGIVLGTALRSLHHWRYFLAPTPDPAPVEMLVNLLYLGPRALVRGVLLLLDRITAKAGRHAEYGADVFASRAGSTEAAVRLMDRILLDEPVSTIVRREAQRLERELRRSGRRRETGQEASRLWEILADEVRTIPEHEYERRRRVSAARKHCADDSHPPTHLRRRRLLSGDPLTAAVVADEAREERVSRELADARRLLAAEIIRDGYAD